MCGIAGIYRLGPSAPPVETGELARMARALEPRGPDGEGLWRQPEVGLAHRRLSVIDLESGQQPIHNEDRSVWTVFNGEIFNYRDLRRRLERAGHRFYTQSDTEVIVHLYEEHGPDFVHELNGQFAIALWDARKRRLLLLRDRVGIAPLFYTTSGARLLFASEVKALLPLLPSSPRLDPHALDELLTFWAPLSPHTMFEGVHELSPGEMLLVDAAGVRRRRYWDWSFPAPGGYRQGSESELAEELHDLLVDATRIRLHADVPVGAYLSGGLDSSAIAALAQRVVGNRLKTFSVGFADRGFDESLYQEAMVEHLGTDHSRILCSGPALAAALPETIYRTEAPVLRTAPVPMGMLSGHVRAQGYKVVLTGEGADEVLGGYDIFKENKIRQFWAARPDSTLRPRLLRRLYPYLDLNQRQGQAYLQQFFGMGLESPGLSYFSHLPRWVTTAKCKQFLSRDYAAALDDGALERLQSALPAGFGALHPLNRAQYLEVKLLMAGYLLSSQGDRMLMSNSVEGRFPFLDHRLIEFANTLAPRMKIKVLREKHLLRQAVGRYLPAAVGARHKQPYRAPDAAALFGPGAPQYVRELLSETQIRRTGYFDPRRVALLLKKAEAGRVIGQKDNMALVAILSTQLWHQHFIDGWSSQDAGRGAGAGAFQETTTGVALCR